MPAAGAVDGAGQRQESTRTPVVFPVQDTRAETPGCETFGHFDNAGASPSPKPVCDRMVHHLRREQMVGGYTAQREVASELQEFYSSAARLINAHPSEIAFAESATRAWDMAFYGINFHPGDRILCCRSEYSSNYLAFLQMRQAKGVEIEIIPDGPDGSLDIGSLANRLDSRVKLVNICHAPTSNGLINDAAAVGAVLRDHPAIYILDACQSIGQKAIDVQTIGCDILSATGRKFLRGPRGTGFLFVASRVLSMIEPPFADLRSASSPDRQTLQWAPGGRRFEGWEYPVAAKLGLKTAIDYALKLGVGNIEARLSELSIALRSRLSQVRGISVLDRGWTQSAITTIASDCGDVSAIQHYLAERALSSTVIDGTDTILDANAPAGRILRLSPHYFNTLEEIENLCSAIQDCTGRRAHALPPRL